MFRLVGDSASYLVSDPCALGFFLPGCTADTPKRKVRGVALVML